MRTLRILVVDDYRDCADALAMLMVLWGHAVETAYTGPEALERARRLPPDVLLLNLSIAPTGGYALGDELRRLPGCDHTALVAVTGSAQPHDFAESAAHGFAAHIVKGNNSAELLAVLQSI